MHNPTMNRQYDDNVEHWLLEPFGVVPTKFALSFSRTFSVEHIQFWSHLCIPSGLKYSPPKMEFYQCLIWLDCNRHGVPKRQTHFIINIILIVHGFRNLHFKATGMYWLIDIFVWTDSTAKSLFNAFPSILYAWGWDFFHGEAYPRPLTP